MLTKSFDEIQQDAKNEGLELWGPDSFCPWPPFFKLHAKVTVDSSGANVQNWIGLLACGVDSCTGLTFPLRKGFDGLNAVEIDIATSALISVSSVVADLCMLNMIAGSALLLTFGGYLALLGTYTLAVGAFIGLAWALPSVWLSRAVLLGIGFALLAMIIGAFAGPIAATFPTILRQQLTGADPATIAAKYVLNSFLAFQLTASHMVIASILFLDPLMWPFAVATFALAITAIYLGYTR